MRTLTAPALSAILAVTIVTLTGNCLLAQSVPAPMQLVGEGTISTDGGEIFPSDRCDRALSDSGVGVDQAAPDELSWDEVSQRGAESECAGGEGYGGCAAVSG